MLDLLLLRNHREVVEDSQKKRFKEIEIIEKCNGLDKEWKTSKISILFILEISCLETIRFNINKIQKVISEKKKATKGQDPCTVSYFYILYYIYLLFIKFYKFIKRLN